LSDNTSNKPSRCREYPDKINWNILSFNPANGVIEFLLENLDKFYIYNLLDNNRRVLYSNRRSLITDMINRVAHPLGSRVGRVSVRRGLRRRYTTAYG
jgi:hypothetical protein